MASLVFTGCSLKKEKVQQPPEEIVNGIVVEYGTLKPIEGVQFVHSDCKKQGFGGCVDWEYTTPVLSKQDGTMSFPAFHLNGPFFFTHSDYWPNMQSDINAFPTTTDNLPIVTVSGPSGQRKFEIQLFPVVPVTFHLVNNKLDPDSAASIIEVSAILSNGLRRATVYPFYLNSVTDTTFTLSGYGNVQNELKVTLANDLTEVYRQTQIFNSRDTIRVGVTY